MGHLVLNSCLDRTQTPHGARSPLCSAVVWCWPHRSQHTTSSPGPKALHKSTPLVWDQMPQKRRPPYKRSFHARSNFPIDEVKQSR